MSLEETYEPAPLGTQLERLRADARHRRLVIAGGALIGLGLGSLHWLGLVIGGALVAVPARTIPRGLAHGLGLGLLGLVVFAGLLATNGALGPVLATGTVGAVAVAVGMGAPLLGSLLRAVV